MKGLTADGLFSGKVDFRSELKGLLKAIAAQVHLKSEDLSIVRIGNFFWLLFVWLIYATGKSLIDDLIRIKKQEIHNLRELWMPSVFLFGMFVISISFYAQKVYPKIHASFGGGKPAYADILISPEGIPVVNLLGMIPDVDRYLRNISIIYENSSFVYVIPTKNGNDKNVTSISLPKKIIEGMRFLSARREKTP